VAVNCAAIPADLLEAEMFGIGKGVATGVVDRPGKFQLAEGGMLFLDEIGDMPLELQAKLLRALQEKEVQPVGGPLVPVDIRVVAATNADLAKRMEGGRFRRDLYYRLAGHVLEVPPLRRRREDVPALVEALLRRFAREAGRSVRGVTAGALRALVEQEWPGNIRELEHVLRRLVQLCPEGEAIDSGLVPLQALPASPEPSPASEGTSLELASRLEVLEEQLVREALARADGNRTQAAKLLGISRNGLAIKMQRLGIEA
jgi:two-component system NtrC family response regulator